MAPAAERRAEVVGQRPDVEAGGAAHAHPGARRRRTRAARARAPSRRRRAAAPACPPAPARRSARRRPSWRSRAAASARTCRETFQRRFESVRATARAPAASTHLARRVVGVGHDAEADRRLVLLVRPVRCCASRVAWPRTSGSTPDACGSSVPVWPMRLTPSDRRAQTTTSCERRADRLVDDEHAVDVLFRIGHCSATGVTRRSALLAQRLCPLR